MLFDLISENFPIVVIAIMILIVTSVTISWVWPGRRRRTAAMTETAVRIGFTHETETGPSPRECFGEFVLFQMRGPDVMYNLMQGKTAGGIKVSLFDHEYLQFQDKDSRQTVAVLESKDTEFPAFSMGPKLKRKLSVEAFRKIGRMVTDVASGYRTVELLHQYEFNKIYRIKSPGDEEKVRSLFTPERTEILTARPGWNLEGLGFRLILYRHDTLVAPKNIRAFLTECEEIARLFIT